jgi:hypothetical protein
MLLLLQGLLLVNNPFNVANADLFDANGQLNTAKLLYANDLDWAKQLQRAGVRRNVDFSYQGKEVIIWCQLEI